MNVCFSLSRLSLGWRQSVRTFCIQFLVLAAALVHSASGATEEVDLSRWRADRLAGLTAPDGWLSLIGRYVLEPGDQTIGAAEDNRLVLPRGSRHLGVVTLDQKNGEVFLTPETDLNGSVDGSPLKGKIKITDKDTILSSPGVAPFTLQVLGRGDQKILRVKDSEAETRTHFAGLNYFPDNLSWRIEAKWEPFVPPRTLKITNIAGIVSEETVPGKAVFEHDGQVDELWPIQQAGEDALFFVFADLTNGKETYGAGRFLYAEAPRNGKVVLDFNRAINPPCAFTPFAICPLSPRQNRMTTRVVAGEKTPAAHP